MTEQRSFRRLYALLPSLLNGFVRRQEVTRCWRKENGAWVIRDICFTEDWDGAQLCRVADDLNTTLRTGGAVFGAFYENRLIGFCAVENRPLLSNGRYRQLSNIHVSAESRGKGVGKRLFLLAADAAREMGAQRLYISAHSSVESQAFYRAMGCVEAEEYDPALTAAEPCDCQLMYVL